MPAGRRAWRVLRHEEPIAGDVFGGRAARPGAIHATAEHGDGGAAGLEGRKVGGIVHAPGEAADHADASARQRASEARGLGEPIGGGRATPDDGDAWSGGDQLLATA